MPNFKRPRRFGTLVLSLCAALALPGGPAAASTEGITVAAADFIVSVGDGEGGERRIASTLVPYRPDQAGFGWPLRRSNVRRVGKESVTQGRARGSPYHSKQHKHKKTQSHQN